MSKPASSSDVEDVKKQQQAMAMAQQAQMLGGQSAQRFGNSLQFQNGNGTSSASMDSSRKKQTEEETTLGELRRKYGIR